MGGDRSLWQLVEDCSSASTDRVLAVDEQGRTVTFGEYCRTCEQVAAGLAACGIGTGSRVSWQLPTWVESLVVIGALSRLGAVQNPMLPIYREREMSFITAQFAPELFIVPSVWNQFEYETTARALAAERAGFEVLAVDREHARWPVGDPSVLAPFTEPQDGAVRWVFYTSGTTAEPKGVQHTDESVIAAAVGALEAIELREDDRGGVVFPLTHIGGVLSLVESLLTSSAMILTEAFDPATTIPVLAREGVTLPGAGTPFFLAYLHAQRNRPETPLFPRARAFPSGGMPKPPDLHEQVKRELGGVGIISGYGLTECPVLAMNTVRDDDEKLTYTEGRPTRGVEVRVRTLDGAPASPGDEGELHVKGPMLFRGYVDPALDTDAFDKDGFLRTGDLGCLDADGYLRITGRVKDIIIRKGENISAQELESLLFAHPEVADVVVIGLPDPESGERVCAVVVASDPAAPPALAGLTDFLRAQGLMPQKLPEQLELVDALPRNPTGKVLKRELADVPEGTR